MYSRAPAQGGPDPVRISDGREAFELTEPVERDEPFGDPGESTVLDVEPDDEPTTIRLLPPGGAERDAEIARPPASATGRKRRRRVGKYELRDRLGSGAFGVVFTARDPSLDRDVAIKVLRPTHLGNPTIVQRFLQEARATARIAHPGIVTIHDCGQVETSLGATAFIAMELLSGESLTSRLQRSGRLPPEAAVEIVRQVASALEAAHRVDVLHRDLKPDNIYVVPDPAVPRGERIKVLDFGLAKLGDHAHTQLRTVFGTPRYMSPEQCRSTAQVDHRSDIYSLGCILFELVTGQPPFDGEVRQVLEHHLHAIAPRARSFAPDVSPTLDHLIAEMLAKDAMDRPQTMGAVQRALLRACETALPPRTAAPHDASDPHPFPPPRAGSEPRGGPPPPQPPLAHSPQRAGSEPRGFPPPPQPPLAHSLQRAGSEPRAGAPPAPPPQVFQFPSEVRSAMRAEAGSGELLMPPSGPRQVLTSELPTSPLPRLNLLRMVALGVLVVALSVLIAWITAG